MKARAYIAALIMIGLSSAIFADNPLVCFPSDLVEKAKNGDAEAQFEVAKDLLNRNYGVRGYADEYSIDVEAVKWLSLAAKQGHVEAQYRLAEQYCSGHGVQDFEEASKWYRAASEKGLADAQLCLGKRGGLENLYHRLS